MPRLIDIRSDISQLTRDLGRIEREQLPYATALATTGVAKRIAEAEVANLDKILDRPTPFTSKSVRVRGATKSSPIATVTMGPIAAQYLDPYLDGGVHYLGGKQALLVPKQQRVNQYGNLPRGKLASLKAQPNVFVGRVKVGGKLVSGVWQRAQRVKHRRAKGAVHSVQSDKGQLKLLIRFEDPQPVHLSLGWFAVPDTVFKAAVPLEFKAAMDRALATAR